MITYFPSIYPDELLYSQLARYYQKSGYTSYSQIVENLYDKEKRIRPNIEFVNKFSTEALQIITRNTTMHDVIMNHTMFPYYARFLNKKQRINAYNSLESMSNDYYRVLTIPKNINNEKRYLRYCPLCAEQDRSKYGEAYWHRIHQINDTDICYIHECYLENTNIIISSAESANLIVAEEVIEQNKNAVTCNDSLKIQISKYLIKMLQANLDINIDTSIGKFINSKLENTKYYTVRGGRKDISSFYSDFMDYYKNLKNNRISEAWQLSRIIESRRINTFEICLLAIFLGISSDELIEMKLPKVSKAEAFDNKVIKLYEQGLTRKEIAKQLNISYPSVVAIVGNRYTKSKTEKKNNKSLKNTTSRKPNWEQTDNETLILVKQIIKQLQEDKELKPKKITISLINKMLNLPNGRLEILPKCKREIEKYYESYEVYWAKVIIWAAKNILKDEEKILWYKIRITTGIHKENAIKAIPHLSQFGDNDIVEKVKNALKNVT